MRELLTKVTRAIADLPELRMADLDLGQLENSEAPALSFPAALVGVLSGQYALIGQQVQDVELTLSLRLAFRTFSRTHTLATTEVRDQGLAHLDTLEAVDDVLALLEGESFKNLQLRQVATEPRADLRVYRMTYLVHYRRQRPSPSGPYSAPASAPDFCLKPIIT
jgi:hypothetical protein